MQNTVIIYQYTDAKKNSLRSVDEMKMELAVWTQLSAKFSTYHILTIKNLKTF